MKNKTQKRIEELENGCGKTFDKDLKYCGEEIEEGTNINWLCPECQKELKATKQTLQEVNERGEKIISKWIQDVNDSEIILELKKELGLVNSERS